MKLPASRRRLLEHSIALRSTHLVEAYLAQFIHSLALLVSDVGEDEGAVIIYENEQSLAVGWIEQLLELLLRTRNLLGELSPLQQIILLVQTHQAVGAVIQQANDFPRVANRGVDL